MQMTIAILVSILQTNTEQHLLFKSEKINTVFIVLLIIWIGIVLHLLYLNRKVSKLEKELQDKISNKDIHR